MRTFTTVWWHWYNRCRKEFTSTSKVFLTLLVLGSFFVPKNVEAQGACDPSYFDVDYDYELDIEGNKTIYTWTITDQNAPNAISHWGFSLNACVPAVVQQFLDAADAFKLVNGQWQPVNYVYGQDNSQTCETGAVLKFDEGITPGIATSYRLVVSGWWSNGIADIYLKYGNRCCIEEIPNTDLCLERICPPALCNINQNTNAQCPGATNTFTATANMESYSWSVSGNGQIQGATNGSTVTVISGNVCGPYTVTLVTNKNGCRFECSKTFTVADSEKPVITLTALGSVPCNPTMAQINAAFGTASVSDNCSQGLVANGVLGDITGTGCNRSVTKSWTVTDACGNTGTNSQTLHYIVDETAPAVTNGATSFTLGLGCNPTNIESNFVVPAFDGGCTTAQVTYNAGQQSGTGCNRTWTRSWEATDCSGLKTTITQTLNWTVDNTAPEVTNQATSFTKPLGCNPSNIAGNFVEPTFSGGCSTAQVSYSAGEPTISGCNGTWTRSWTANDCSGIPTTITQVLTWTVDNAAPVVNNGATSFTKPLGCNPANIEANFVAPTFDGGCSQASVTPNLGTPSVTGCNGTWTRSWEATDCSGLKTTITQTLTWTVDNDAPTVSNGATSFTKPLGCNPTNIEANFVAPTFSGGCSDATVTPNPGAASGPDCNRTWTRSWTATDCSGKTTTITQTLTWTVDNTAPVITLRDAVATLGCNPSQAAIDAAFGSVSASDNCSVGTPVVTTDNIVVNGCQRSLKKTWNVSDACGNPAAPVSHTVTWTVDNAAPVVNNGATSFTKPLGCNPANIEANFVAPTFDGGCSQASVTPNLGTPSVTGCNGTWTRSWEATDCSGLKTTITQTLTWTVDNDAPTVSNGATSFTKPLGCNPTNIEANFVAPTFSGGCSDATVTPNPGAASGPDCNRTWTRSWTATDCSGKTTTITQTLTWTVDNTAPVTSGTPTSIEANCGTQFADLPWQAPTWSDVCGGVTIVSDVITPNGQQISCPAVYTRTWTVKDACNNRASFTQTITVPCCKACTYTQGFYGNFNGKACMEDGSIATASSLMTLALNAEPNDEFIFGSKSNNRYWVLKLSDVNQGKASNIFKMLPGGGPSQMLGVNTSVSVLSTFDNKSTWSVAPLQTKKPNEGKITNSLLAQTIVLYFNIETSPSLGSIALTSNVLITADVECGESTAIPGTNEEFTLPSAIVTYLNTNSRGYDNTVAGLFQLANDVLGGINPDNVSLSAVSEAVDVINNAFDECRVLVGYGSIGSSITSTREKEESELSKEVLSGKLSVTASPNPFNDKVRFTIESPVSGQGSLEVYNLIGQKVETVFQGFLIEGRGQTVEYKVAPANRTNLIYVLRVGGQQVTGKLINVR